MFKRLAVLIGVQRALCIPTNELREMAKPCAPGQECEMDGYVGSKVIFEDDLVRVWNFTLPPGGMTSLHRHDLDYHFIAIIPTQLEVYDWQGTRLFDFRAEGTKGFRVKGDLLEPTVGTLPTPLPRLHSALNIGLNDYYEVLVEHKHRFSHELKEESEALRAEKLRLQVEYYLSDENLASDAFFQALIRGSSGGWVPISTLLGCPRIQQLQGTGPELVAALRWSTQLQLREWPVGAEEVRRKSPLPELQVPRAPEPLKEDTLDERPLPLLRDCSDGWEAVIEDLERRSFCFLKRRSVSEALLQEEFERLLAFADWQKLHSKAGAVTRSTAWYVTAGCCCRYTYGEASVPPVEKPEWLESIEARILGELCGLAKEDWPNSVNMNLYEDESQNVGWHSDDEGLFRGCQTDCRIISASWGAPRRFEIALKDRGHISGKPRIFPDTLQAIDLHPGDLCSMEGAFQRHYSHQIAKGTSPGSSPREIQEGAHKVRINLTWRYIVSHKAYCPRKEAAREE
ncbi:La-related protein 6A (AtLARP6a) [Durusdinium trenchii]|uniref:La-related protein 6A (AtLARP6a) n=1 Tax=Durusdinium trenchii TaxID=1381693 RepID=A0ABP0LUJ8_9DINO